MKHILIVEDDNKINNLLNDLLSEEYEITQAFAGSEAYRLVVTEEFDLIITDLMLPGLSGEELITKIREDTSTPIVVVTAKGEVAVLTHVFSLGANDYIAKPFNNKEVLARVSNQFKNNPSKEEANSTEITTYGPIAMDEERHEITVNDTQLHLTQKEYELLRLFLLNPSKVFTKSNLYESVWEEPYFGDDNTISVHISRLRNKIASCGEEEMIETVWGVGFKLKDL